MCGVRPVVSLHPAATVKETAQPRRLSAAVFRPAAFRNATGPVDGRGCEGKAWWGKKLTCVHVSFGGGRDDEDHEHEHGIRTRTRGQRSEPMSGIRFWGAWCWMLRALRGWLPAGIRRPSGRLAAVDQAMWGCLRLHCTTELQPKNQRSLCPLQKEGVLGGWVP